MKKDMLFGLWLIMSPAYYQSSHDTPFTFLSL